MRTRKLRTIARRWWRAQGGTYDWDRVYRILLERHDLVPHLIGALAETAPDGELKYLGPAVVETLEDFVDLGLRRGRSRTLQLVMAAGLRKDQLLEVLGGAYSRCLAGMGVAEALAGVLSPEELAWLLDDFAPGRFEYPPYAASTSA
jgi:hypothetical protein